MIPTSTHSPNAECSRQQATIEENITTAYDENHKAHFQQSKVDVSGNKAGEHPTNPNGNPVSNDQWQTQKKKYFKGNSQNTQKKKMEMASRCTFQFRPRPQVLTKWLPKIVMLLLESRTNTPLPIIFVILLTTLRCKIDKYSGSQEKPTNLQDGVPKGGDLSHVLNENSLIDPRKDFGASATTVQSATFIHQVAQTVKFQSSDIAAGLVQSMGTEKLCDDRLHIVSSTKLQHLNSCNDAVHDQVGLGTDDAQVLGSRQVQKLGSHISSNLASKQPFGSDLAQGTTGRVGSDLAQGTTGRVGSDHSQVHENNMGSNQNIAVRVQDSSTHQMQVQCSILGADQQHVLGPNQSQQVPQIVDTRKGSQSPAQEKRMGSFQNIMVMTPDSSTPQRQVHDSFLRLEQRHVLSSDLGSKQLQTTLQQEVDKVLLENKTSKVQQKLDSNLHQKTVSSATVKEVSADSSNSNKSASSRTKKRREARKRQHEKRKQQQAANSCSQFVLVDQVTPIRSPEYDHENRLTVTPVNIKSGPLVQPEENTNTICNLNETPILSPDDKGYGVIHSEDEFDKEFPGEVNHKDEDKTAEHLIRAFAPSKITTIVTDDEMNQLAGEQGSVH
ncbi:hypothetical protein KY284_012571 [Solanum tuberosum]|nr:hypothetical protein KY284_012571 [Solanum tuberosum]